MKPLFSEFPEIPTKAWEEKIRSDLKDPEAIDKLTAMTDEGIPVKPFYRKEDLDRLKYLEGLGKFRKPASAPNGWSVCQEVIAGNDPGKVRQTIKDALKGGAQSIRIRFGSWSNPDFSSLGILLEGVPFEETEMMFQGTIRADALYDSLCDLTHKKGKAPVALTGCIGADPLGIMISTGIPVASMENLAGLLHKIPLLSPGMRVIDVHGSIFQDAGSTLAEELAFALAIANEYMSVLSGKGVDPSTIQSAMQLGFATGPDFFLEIAKLRAARLLWATIAGEYGISPDDAKIPIHTTTSSWNQTLYDPHVNMLRGTTEAMASILGGADYLTVLPFDYPYGESNAFSNRIARNVPIILREEAYLDRVSDPAAGSFYIESLTDSIAEKAWGLFLETEAKGGFRMAFEKGWVQERVLASRKLRLQKIASGKEHLVGTNSFPLFSEQILPKLEKSTTTEPGETALFPIAPFRPASLFEGVRLATEKSEVRPKVFLFKFGDPAWSSARATFSGNFFACAGYEILDPGAITSINDGINSARNTKAEIIVLCSSDAEYSEIAPQIASELGSVSLLVIAGDPRGSMEPLKKAGISHFIHRKSHLLETLEEFNAILLK